MALQKKVVLKVSSVNDDKGKQQMVLKVSSMNDKKVKQKVVLKVSSMNNEKVKQEVMETVANICGIDSISIDHKDKKMTVIGDMDPVDIAMKLKKFGEIDIVSVGPTKEEKKDNKKAKNICRDILLNYLYHFIYL